MTSPNIGRAEIEVHADTSPFDPELEKGIQQASKDAEKILDKIGETWGETLADSTSKELESHGQDFADAIDKSLSKTKVKANGDWFDFRTGRWRNARGQFARDLAEGMSEEVENAFQRATRPGGVFSKIGEGIADAIGSGFNISGRSPLIAVLIPMIGAVGLAIVGLIQAVNGFAAALVAVPPLIAGIAAQVFVLVTAFDGVGEAVTGAFAAKNAQELNEAIKGLTPSAQAFVKSLLPIRDLFNDLKRTIQENFFKEFGDSLAPTLRALIEVSKPGLAQVATALGQFFAQLSEFFRSKVFLEFVRTVLPATARWVQSFGPVFTQFLEALTRMATTAIPFLEKLGQLLNRVFLKVTNKINEMVEDGSLAEWLDRMFVTIEKIGSVFGSLINFVVSFIGAIDQAGGNEALDKIAEWVNRLAFFFASPVGVEALKGMINLAIILTEAFGGLVVIFSTLFAAFQFAAEAIQAFFTWVGDSAIPWLESLDEKVGTTFGGIVDWAKKIWWALTQAFHEVVGAVVGAFGRIAQFFVDVKNGIVTMWNKAIEFIKSVPGKILDAVGDLGRLLFEAGKAVITGLWDGLKAAWHAVEDWLRSVGDWITNLKGPLDYDRKLLVPAGEAIMGGLEAGMKDKVLDVYGLAREVTNTLADVGRAQLNMTVPQVDPMALSATQNVYMNMGGLHFDGTPSETQARSAGRAVAGGAQSQLAQQQVRIAVRSI